MGITIDEAIAHAREVEKQNRYKAKTYDDDFLNRFLTSKEKCEQCAQENEQLADWLEELKILKNKNEHYLEVDELDGYGYSCTNKTCVERIRNKAIDDLVFQSKKVRASGLITNWGKPFGIEFDKLDEIAEQLKAGDVE